MPKLAVRLDASMSQPRMLALIKRCAFVGVNVIHYRLAPTVDVVPVTLVAYAMLVAERR